jgi:putative NADH-flavin reductase
VKSHDEKKKQDFDALKEQGVKIITGDISNKDSLIRAFNGFDVVISAIASALVDQQTIIIFFFKSLAGWFIGSSILS